MGRVQSHKISALKFYLNRIHNYPKIFTQYSCIDSYIQFDFKHSQASGHRNITACHALQIFEIPSTLAAS